MIVNKYNQGGGGSGSGMTPQQVQQQIDTSLTPYWDSGETKDYVDEAVSGISLEGYYTSAQTEEAIISKGYASQDQVDEIDEVVAESLNDLNERVTVLEVSGGTPSVDLSGYYTSAQTEDVISAATAGKADAVSVSANNNSLKFPYWNSQGVITDAFYDSFTRKAFGTNGRNINFLVGAGSANIDSIYGPTTPGTAGDVLVSTGNGAPVWSAVTIPDMSEYYTSAQTNTAISAATQNMVTSTTITTMWRGSQADYDTLTNSGATADSGTFYIIIPNNN